MDKFSSNAEKMMAGVVFKGEQVSHYVYGIGGKIMSNYSLGDVCFSSLNSSIAQNPEWDYVVSMHRLLKVEGAEDFWNWYAKESVFAPIFVQKSFDHVTTKGVEIDSSQDPMLIKAGLIGVRLWEYPRIGEAVYHLSKCLPMKWAFFFAQFFRAEDKDSFSLHLNQQNHNLFDSSSLNSEIVKLWEEDMLDFLSDEEFGRKRTRVDEYLGRKAEGICFKMNVHNYLEKGSKKGSLGSLFFQTFYDRFEKRRETVYSLDAVVSTIKRIANESGVAI